MNAIPLLAWRNLWRNRKRTALTVAGVGFAAAILVFFQSIQFSAFDASIASTSHVLTGHLQLQREDYLAKPELKRSFRLEPGVIEKIRRLPQVVGASAGIETSAIVSTGERSFVAVVTGVDPQGEKTVSNVPERVVDGQYLAPGKYDGAVVGEKLAHNLGVVPGDEISLVGQDRDGSLVTEVLSVSGIVRSGMTEVDRALVQINASTFDQLFSMDGSISRVKVLAESVEVLDQVRQNIELLIAADHPAKPGARPVVIRGWDELVPGLRQAINLDMSAAWMFYGVLLLVCAISVLNTFLMAVLERETEFALLMSLGVSPIRVGLSIVIESALLILLGLLGGILAATALLSYFGHFGFVIPGSEEILKMWALPSRLYPRFLPTPWVRGIGAVIAVGILAMILPLLRLGKIDPVEARR